MDPEDHSLEFHACPGRLRQVQIVRDRLLQLLAADPGLEPRDILVMTPDIDGFAPLVASVFGDGHATGVELPWRLTDRSQQDGAGMGSTLLLLLELAGTRLTATGLETLLGCRPLLERFSLELAEATRLVEALQEAGFRWGLDGQEKDPPCHSLAWTIDRLLLGLVLPADAGLAPGETAPWEAGVPLELAGRWLHLLGRLRHWLAELRRGGTVGVWAERLRRLIDDLFGDTDDDAGERPELMGAIDAWQTAAGPCALSLEAPVAAAALRELLGAESGRFGHRSGALTISALEPMRAIPYRVIVLMGLDAGLFPRPGDRPAFHLMEGQRQLGDPHPADQDRYVLMEALLSARDHLLLSWSCRDDRTGAALPPPDRWANGCSGWPASWMRRPWGSCWWSTPPTPSTGATSCPPAGGSPQLRPAAAGGGAPPGRRSADTATGAAGRSDPSGGSPAGESEAYADLRDWLVAPQTHWLRSLGLRPGEWEKRVDDLEALALGERERSSLLRATLSEADTGGEAPLRRPTGSTGTVARACCRQGQRAPWRRSCCSAAGRAWRTPWRPSARPGAPATTGAPGRPRSPGGARPSCWRTRPRPGSATGWSSGSSSCWPAPPVPPRAGGADRPGRRWLRAGDGAHGTGTGGGTG